MITLWKITFNGERYQAWGEGWIWDMTSFTIVGETAENAIAAGYDKLRKDKWRNIQLTGLSKLNNVDLVAR